MNFLKNSETVMASGSVNKAIQESILYTGYSSRDGSNRILFLTKDSARSNENVLLQVTNSGFTKYTVLRDCQVVVSSYIKGSVFGDANGSLIHYNSSDVAIQSAPTQQGSSGEVKGSITTKASAGDYFVVTRSDASLQNSTATNFSITATATEEVKQNLMVTLPTGKENVFSARILNSGTASIASQNADAISSVSRTGAGIVTVTFKAGLFTVAPLVVAVPLTTTADTSNDDTIRLENLTTSGFTVNTRRDSVGATDMDFGIMVQKQGVDYTHPSVYVGVVQPDRQTTLTVTGSGWTTARAVGIPYKTADGAYRLKFNIAGAYSGGSVAGIQFTVSNVTFKTIAASNGQACAASAFGTGHGAFARCIANSNASTLDINTTIAFTSLTLQMSGDVELESKPSFATWLE